ncbi:hypothetical protein L6R52_02905 [Myxococcota bacterium]|nr:hypothetical protein [Myxococcota bacterium]
MAASKPPAPRRRPSARTRAPSKTGRGETSRSLVRLLDDDLDHYTVHDWRVRNLRLYDELVDLGFVDPHVVPAEAHRFLTEALIQVMNGAATDPQNAGHVRAQNENILHFGLAARVPKRTLTIALAAGFIHDLNKAMGEPLRQDELGVRDVRGRLVPMMTTMAQIVGLNHLGERTRSTLAAATRLSKGALDREVFAAIDRCIVHHGLGSSRFIRELVAGKNPWWGEEFVDPVTGVQKLVHPAQPPLTLESVIHDLADSTQQMQGGAAWLMKYPAGFWRGSGRSLADMLSGGDPDADAAVPMSLRLQIDVETATCREIIVSAEAANIIDAALAVKLLDAVGEATRSSRQWIEDDAEYLADRDGESVYHDLGRALGVAPETARDKLAATISGTPEADELETVLWRSGRRVDLQRARDLAHRILGPTEG